MSSKQVEANRRNALQSTGPRSAEGKQNSSMNALKHGLLSSSVLLEAEDEAKFSLMRDQMFAALDPDGPIEILLVNRVVANSWRLERFLKVEAGLFRSFGYEVDLEPNDSPSKLSEKFSSRNRSFQGLSRYEIALERGLIRALHELERLQAKRSGVITPPPLAIDIAGLYE